MTNRALIYRRPSKWPIASALAAAVLLHLSAVAIAFHRESLASRPAAADDSVAVGLDPAGEPTTSPESDISLPPPPPAPSSDFIEPQNIEPELRPLRSPAPIRATGQTHLPAVGNAKIWAVNAPRPDHPYEARSRHITGSGVAIISVDETTGFATAVTMEQSIGSPILDNATVSTLRRWRFKPGSPARVRIPITFLLSGVQY